MLAFQTERFDVFKYRVPMCPGFYEPRDVYLAFFQGDGLPRPVCTVTIDDHSGYVEWIETASDHRRMGIAREVLRGIEKLIGEVVLDGATDEGEAFCDAYCGAPNAA